MKVRYDILVSLQMKHTFHLNELFEDFELVPDEKTKKLVEQYRLLIKKSKNNWFLFYQREGPLMQARDFFAEQELSFVLKITDDSFYFITNDIYLPGKDELMFYGTKLDSSLVPEPREIFPFKFVYQIRHSQRPLALELTRFKGNKVQSETVVDPAKVQWPVDLSQQGIGAYNLSEDTVPSTDNRLIKLFVEATSTEKVYGIVYFKIVPGADLAPNSYQIKFQKK